MIFQICYVSIPGHVIFVLGHMTIVYSWSCDYCACSHDLVIALL